MAAECSGLRVPGEMHLDALGQEALPSALAAAGKDGPPVLGGHTLAKAELLLARALGWLIGAFWHGWKKGAQISGTSALCKQKVQTKRDFVYPPLAASPLRLRPAGELPHADVPALRDEHRRLETIVARSCGGIDHSSRINRPAGIHRPARVHG